MTTKKQTKRYLIPAARRAEICRKTGPLEIRFTTSRGAETYGWNICTLRIDGRRVASCKGGGYDMRGTCLADWIKKQFPDELRRLSPAEYYGLSFWDPRAKKRRKHFRPGYIVGLDGGCGWNSMERILNAFGFRMVWRGESAKSDWYTLEAL